MKYLDSHCGPGKCCICAKNCLDPSSRILSDGFILANKETLETRVRKPYDYSSSDIAFMTKTILQMIREERETKEKEYMDNREILKELDEAIKLNKEARSKNNDAMCHAKNALSSGVNADSDSYKQGLTDAYDLIKRLYFDSTLPSNLQELFPILDCTFSSIHNILIHYSIHEIKKKVESWDKEQAKPKLGDVVKINFKPEYDTEEVGVYIYGNEDYIRILRNADKKLLDITHISKKLIQSIEKTGKHFDIQSMLDEIG